MAWLLLPFLMVLDSRARAEEARLYVDVPPGPLRDAVDQLAACARLQVLYDAAILTGRRSEGVKGSMTPSHALERLLASTGIAYQFTGQNAVALYRQSPAAADELPASAVASPAASLPTISVEGRRPESDGYFTNTTLSAMRNDSLPLTTPVTSETISEQLLQDQEAGRVEDILESVSAIEAAPDGQSALGFSIRGFPTYQYYVDGVRVSPDLHHDGYRDLADVQRIDIVKGPASTLYGRTEPGGLINIVTKQPLSSPYVSAWEQIGAFGHRRTQLDTGGPLSPAGEFLYRFNAALESCGSFRQGLRNHRLFLAPVVTWRISQASELTAYAEYLRSGDPADSGLPVIGTGMPPVSIAQRIENGGEIRTRDLHVGVRGSHSFNDQWTARYHLDGRWLQTPQAPQLALADNGLEPGSCTRASCPVDQWLLAVPVSTGNTYYSSLELLGSARLGWTRHSLLVGVEYFEVRGYQEVIFSDTGFTTDLYARSQDPVPAALLRNPDEAYATRTSEQWSGVYLQDQIALGERLSLLLGARFDQVREWLDTAAGLPLTDLGADRRWDHAFKRRVGLLWRATPELSFYTHYLENFGISTGIYGGEGSGGSGGALVPPESAREWEIGAKSQLLQGRISGSLAWFNLTQTNTPVPVFSAVGNAVGFVTVTGLTRSRGAELELQGEIGRGVKVIGSYAFLDSRIIDDRSTRVDALGNSLEVAGNTGRRFFGVPRHGGSLWLSYRPGGALQHLRLGIGVVARSWREGDNANDYQVPGFTRWNLLAGYELPLADGRLGLQLNVNNLFNRRYFESLNGSNNVMPGAPRRWLLTVRLNLN